MPTTYIPKRKQRISYLDPLVKSGDTLFIPKADFTKGGILSLRANVYAVTLKRGFKASVHAVTQNKDGKMTDGALITRL